MKCAHCGREGIHKWDVTPCALGKQIKRRLCDDCDYDLNEYVLGYFKVRNRAELMRLYQAASNMAYAEGLEE